MKIVYTGIESSGKTLMLARESISLIKRNRYWQKKYGFTRKIVSNLKFSFDFYSANSQFIDYWDDMRQVIGLTGCDIIWDEISSDFSALKKEPMSKITNRWLRQGAKQGVHIYATAQEYHDIHLDFRRRVFSAFSISKILGSSRSGFNLPPVRFIWGLCSLRQLKINPYNELLPEHIGLPSPLWITPELCSVFDTHQVIKNSAESPYEHILKKCNEPGCGYSRIIHR